MPLNQKLRVLDIAFWATFASVTVASTFTLYGRDLELRSILTVAAVLGSLLLIRTEAHRGAVRAASWLLCVLLWSVITVTVMVHGGIATPAASGYIIVVLLASLLLGTRASVLVTAASVFVGLAATSLELSGNLPIGDDLTTPIAAFGTLAALFAWASMVMHFYERNIEQALTLAREREKIA